jgi:hypothetical protein
MSTSVLTAPVPSVSAAAFAETHALPVELRVHRRRLLRAMATVCARDDFPAATVTRLCRDAHVPRAVFAQLFDDPQACLVATLREGYAVAERRLRRTCSRRHENATSVARAWVAELVAIASDDRALAHVCVVQAAAAGPAGVRERRRAVDRLVALLEAGGHMPPGTGITIVATALEALHIELTRPHGPNLHILEDALLSACLTPQIGPRAAHAYVTQWARVRGDLPPTARDGDPARSLLDVRLTPLRARLLDVVADRPGVSNEDLQRALGIRHASQVSRVLAWLAENGLLTRTSAGRHNAWRLTAHARELLDLDG